MCSFFFLPFCCFLCKKIYLFKRTTAGWLATACSYCSTDATTEIALECKKKKKKARAKKNDGETKNPKEWKRIVEESLLVQANNIVINYAIRFNYINSFAFKDPGKFMVNILQLMKINSEILVYWLFTVRLFVWLFVCVCVRVTWMRECECWCHSSFNSPNRILYLFMYLVCFHKCIPLFGATPFTIPLLPSPLSLPPCFWSHSIAHCSLTTPSANWTPMCSFGGRAQRRKGWTNFFLVIRILS